MANDTAEGRVTNDSRKLDKLIREATRAHEWRVQVWAQMQSKIKVANASIEALGGQPYEPWEPDFTDPEAVAHYSSMTLTK